MRVSFHGMFSGRGLFLLFALVTTAYAAEPSPTPSPTPEPNTVNLRGLDGDYVGKSSVTLGKFPTYRGVARIAMRSRLAYALGVTIRARVRTPGGFARIDNVLTFQPDGVVRGQKLASGIARGAAFKGRYHATPRRIIFEGEYAFQSSTGSFQGLIAGNAKGRLSIHLAVFVTGSADAVYTYDYLAPRRR